MSYCITSANQIIPEDTLPSIEEEVLTKGKLDVFQQMFYNENVLFNEDQDPVGISITKLDRANDSESSQDEDIIVKSVFGINCEVNEIIQLVNSSSHCKCEFNQKQYEQNCFFCLMRSSCSRLCINRTKGPRSLKLNEITSQLFQYERNLDWNWKTEGHDLMMFLENTVKLLVRYEKKTLSVFGFPTGQFLKCHRSMKMEKRVIFRINSYYQILQSNRYSYFGAR